MDAVVEGADILTETVTEEAVDDDEGEGLVAVAVAAADVETEAVTASDGCSG